MTPPRHGGVATSESSIAPEEVVGVAVRDALDIVDANLVTFGDRFPHDNTVDEVYQLRPAVRGWGQDLPAGSNYGWTTSFWSGQLWLAWELTGRDRYRDLALAHVESFARRVRDGVDLDHHDLGFLYSLACVTPDRLVGSAEGRCAALAAADLLMRRFLEPAGIIQAWGDLSDPAEQGRGIIDSLLNMPLLYWASKVSGERRYAEAAERHTRQLQRHIVRDDDTTFHTFHWDPVTGEPRSGSTHQGHADDSCWARGQAWGIYGFALAYRHTGDATFLRTAARCADYFLAHLPRDGVAFWDLVFSDGDDQPRDSSSAAIAACGLLELAEGLAGADGVEEPTFSGEIDDDATTRVARYREAAVDMVTSLAERYTPRALGAQSNALLLHGVYNLPRGMGIDEGNLWGDYYYLEALVRLRRPDWVPYW
ncbi:glycoside hydrolase family 88 protein [Salana multivorans]|uniref:glycoside hydrolase family 88 protein n=1 Tax=Salana multivorans TaxID=120377 RepID=UPI00248FCAF4|nr:glycoside hydrolase family 88 protein [Salana multivorans]